jgi:hypothetical protein
MHRWLDHNLHDDVLIQDLHDLVLQDELSAECNTLHHCPAL